MFVCLISEYRNPFVLTIESLLEDKLLTVRDTVRRHYNNLLVLCIVLLMREMFGFWDSSDMEQFLGKLHRKDRVHSIGKEDEGRARVQK